jgi:hypothetical protein
MLYTKSCRLCLSTFHQPTPAIKAEHRKKPVRGKLKMTFIIACLNGFKKAEVCLQAHSLILADAVSAASVRDSSSINYVWLTHHLIKLKFSQLKIVDIINILKVYTQGDVASWILSLKLHSNAMTISHHDHRTNQFWEEVGHFCHWDIRHYRQTHTSKRIND